jgi:hypothetical protein
MNATHDLNKARWGMQAPHSEESPGGRVVPFEATCWAECEMFLRCGYTVMEFRWDADTKQFERYQNFLPGDL